MGTHFVPIHIRCHKNVITRATFICNTGYENDIDFVVIGFSFCRKNLAVAATSDLTTCLTIYRARLLGNSANKRPRKHRFRTEKHTKVVKNRYFTAMELFGSKMSQVQILSFRPYRVFVTDSAYEHFSFLQKALNEIFISRPRLFFVYCNANFWVSNKITL